MLAQATDAELVDDMSRDWYTPHSRADLLAGMARFRATYEEAIA